METVGSAPKKEPEILSEMSKLDGSISSLSDEVHTLSSRINLVQKQDPQEDSTHPCGVESSCEMSNTISGFRSRIESIRDTVRYQTEMLEI